MPILPRPTPPLLPYSHPALRPPLPPLPAAFEAYKAPLTVLGLSLVGIGVNHPAPLTSGTGR